MELSQTLRTTLTGLNKKFGSNGEDVIFVLKEAAKRFDVNRIPTGIATVDWALGGGFMPGRIAEIYGPESGGKSTLLYTTMAGVQRRGGVCVLFDVEQSVVPEYLDFYGVDSDSLIVCQATCAEDVYNMSEYLIRTNEIDLIGVDSVAALVTRSEIEAGFDKETIGALARLNTKAMRLLNDSLNKTKTAFLLINQQREVMNPATPYSEKFRTPGGKAIAYYASQRIDVRRTDTHKQGDESVGIRTKVTVKKNKLSPPFRTAEYDVWFYDGGIDTMGSLVTLAEQHKVVKKSGAWYSYTDPSTGEVLKFQGLRAMVDDLKQEGRAGIVEQIRAKTMEAIAA